MPPPPAIHHLPIAPHPDRRHLDISIAACIILLRRLHLLSSSHRRHFHHHPPPTSRTYLPPPRPRPPSPPPPPRPTRPPATYLPPSISTPGPTYLPPYKQQHGATAESSAASNIGISSFPAGHPSSFSHGSSSFPAIGVVKLSEPAGGSSFATASSSASASASSDASIVQQNYPSQSVPSVSILATPIQSPLGPSAGYPASTSGYPSFTPSPQSPTAGYR
ncbi:uncharacterized protein LOC126851641 [Cataglyphis hispanica]|uniref:uncharacterized protein LOC126851641 n=1 Tax=Cataglyphis hispanica TaxID=1086592 RepID=UPI00217FF9C7|nr:uncharacterized protein LOC126851641 [Cataglyphis hispanica]